MKNNLPYFEHDSDAGYHWKHEALRVRFGWAGYGRFWRLNELISAAENCKIRVENRQIRADSAAKLGLSVEEFDEFLGFLADPDQCGLVKLTEDGSIITERTQDCLTRVMKRRAWDRDRRISAVESRKSTAEKQDKSSKSTAEKQQSRETRDISNCNEYANASPSDPPDPLPALAPSALKELCARYLPAFRGSAGDWAQFAAILIRKRLDAEYVRWLGQVYLPAQRGIDNRGAWIRTHFGEEEGAYRTWAVQEAQRRAPPPVEPPPPADPAETEATVQAALAALPFPIEHARALAAREEAKRQGHVSIGRPDRVSELLQPRASPDPPIVPPADPADDIPPFEEGPDEPAPA